MNDPVEPRSAYIHVPFCAHRCGYCNFALVAGRSDLIGPYLRAIELELSQLGEPLPVDTLYFGGGTPTQLSCDQFRRLADCVLRWHPLAKGHEWTVEANPADVTGALVELLAELGVTRLSIGGQSFHERKLQLLERDHQPANIERSVGLARRAGLQVAIDLIFATPGETLADWQADLDAVLALEPDHVSTYGLTFERGTSFESRRQKGTLQAIDERLERNMFEAAIDTLTGAGFEHYEVSNFARPGCRSRHNQVYWAGGEYFAAGPGAARYVAGVRETNHRSTTTYLKRMSAGESPVAEREMLTREARAREMLVFGLRRIDGVCRAEFQAASGFAIEELAAAAITKFVAMGLLEDDGQRARLTREGLMLSDAIWPELL